MKPRNSLLVHERPPSQCGHGRSGLSLDFLTRLIVQLGLALALSFTLAGSTFVQAQQAGAKLISFPVAIQWPRQKGVAKYRLQIASDETFRDIFFDGRVQGERYIATALPPGYYYWRMAPADSSTGLFSTPVRFFVSGGEVISPVPPEKSDRRSRLRTVAKNR